MKLMPYAFLYLFLSLVAMVTYNFISLIIGVATENYEGLYNGEIYVMKGLAINVGIACIICVVYIIVYSIQNDIKMFGEKDWWDRNL